MKFDERFIGGIRRGEITMTCRRAPNPVTSIDVGRSYIVERWRPEPKDEFGVRLKIRKGRRAGEEMSGVWEPTDMRIVIRHLERSLLHQITDDDARAQGFADSFELFDWWIERHREGCGHRLPRFPDLHVEVPVWLVRFELDASHRPRLLAARSQHGYTADPREALPEEPEAIDRATLDHYAKEARDADADRESKRHERWEKMSAAEKVSALEGAAAEGLDVHRALARVHQAADAARKRLQRRAA